MIIKMKNYLFSTHINRFKKVEYQNQFSTIQYFQNFEFFRNVVDFKRTTSYFYPLLITRSTNPVWKPVKTSS